MAQYRISLFRPDGSERTQEELLSEIASIDRGTTIVLNGPEPGAHPAFPEIIRAISQRGSVPHALFSDGHHLTNLQNLDLIKSASTLNLFITPFHQESFSAMDHTGFNAHFQSSLTSIVMLLSCGLKVAAAIPITPENAPYLKDIVTGISNTGLDNIFLFFPAGKDGAPTQRYSEIHPHSGKAINSVNPIVHIENLPACMLGSEHEHASHIFTIDDPSKRQSRPCGSCARKETCPGVSSAYLERFGDSELHALDDTGEPLFLSYNRPLPNERAEIKNWPLAIHEAAKQITAAATTPALAVSADEIMHAIEAIERHPQLWGLIEHLGYPIPVLVQILERLENQGIIAIGENSITINQGPEVSSDEPQDFSGKRVESDPTYCQLRVSHADLARRARYIIERCPAGGRIAVLGDDDFMSLTLASTGHFEHVTVFEIDPRISSRIKAIADEKRLPVHVKEHDLREPFPPAYLGRYDAFYTDSPYSVNGLKLFVSRGVELLKPGTKKHGFASFSPEIPVMEEVELEAQRVMTEIGLFIEQKTQPAANIVPDEVRKRFPTYETLKAAAAGKTEGLTMQDQWHLGALGRKEYLFHFLTTSKTQSLIHGAFHEDIYYDIQPLQWYIDKFRAPD